MNGFMKKSLAAMSLAGGLAVASGCDSYRNLVDTNYPERYERVARQEFHDAVAPQIANGHALDQTVWNHHFEAGTDKLTLGGQQHLNYLVRRRPAPDGTVYLQTAQDVRFDSAAPDRFAAVRTDLDNRRIQAVQNYLNAYAAGRNLSFEVFVHDPGEVGISAANAGSSMSKLATGFQGNLPSSAGAGASNSTGGGGGGGGASGGSGK